MSLQSAEKSENYPKPKAALLRDPDDSSWRSCVDLNRHPHRFRHTFVQARQDVDLGGDLEPHKVSVVQSGAWTCNLEPFFFFLQFTSAGCKREDTAILGKESFLGMDLFAVADICTAHQELAGQGPL